MIKILVLYLILSYIINKERRLTNLVKLNAYSKEQIRSKFLVPKNELKRLRREKEITTFQLASAIGISRRQYELKERGKYPFNDYEMLAIAKVFGKKIENIFFKN